MRTIIDPNDLIEAVNNSFGILPKGVTVDVDPITAATESTGSDGVTFESIQGRPEDNDALSDIFTATNDRFTVDESRITGVESVANAGIILTSVDFVATMDVPAFSAVIASGIVADSTVLSHRLKVIGISNAAVTNGMAGKAISAGEIKNDAWTWSVGDRIFINGNTLSNVAPSSVWSQEIGIAVAANSIMVNLKQSILL